MSIQNINWYPGHMKKTREMITENLKLVDLVIEIVDSRIPVSSRNPIVHELIQNKDRVAVLGKADLSDSRETEKWCSYFNSLGYSALAMNTRSGENLKKLFKVLDQYQQKRDREKSNKRPLRIMVVGVPNVGKSSLINRMTGRKSTRTGDRPGVTKGKQWVILPNGMQLLDTPGILWPKFEDPDVGLNLAFCGSIKDEILDVPDLALELIKVLQSRYPEMLISRYKLEGLEEEALANMEAIALKRGFIFPGKRIDYERTGRTVLDEFRSGKIGKITLEQAD